MKKEDFLKHFCPMMMGVVHSKKNHIMLNAFDHTVQYLSISNHVGSGIEIKDKNLLAKLMNEGFSFNFSYNSSFGYCAEPYIACLKELFSSNQQHWKDHFIKHSNTLIGNFTLILLNELIPHLSQRDITDIMLKGKSQLGKMDPYGHQIEHFKETVELLKRFDNHEELVLGYLKTRLHPYIKTIDTDNQTLLKGTIKQSLLQHFPERMEYFQELKFIDEYLQNSRKPLFLEHDNNNSFYERLDLNIALHQSVKPLALNDYCGLLSTFCNQLNDSKHWGIEDIVCHHRVKNKTYHYSDIVVFTQPSKQLDHVVCDSARFQQMLTQFISSLHGKKIQSEDYIKYTQSWIASYILKEYLPINNKINSKKHKL